jgi:hypothetical protein
MCESFDQWRTNTKKKKLGKRNGGNEKLKSELVIICKC